MWTIVDIQTFPLSDLVLFERDGMESTIKSNRKFDELKW